MPHSSRQLPQISELSTQLVCDTLGLVYHRVLDTYCCALPLVRYTLCERLCSGFQPVQLCKWMLTDRQNSRMGLSCIVGVLVLAAAFRLGGVLYHCHGRLTASHMLPCQSPVAQVALIFDRVQSCFPSAKQILLRD